MLVVRLSSGSVFVTTDCAGTGQVIQPDRSLDAELDWLVGRTMDDAKRLIDDMAPGQVLLLLSDCPGTPDDLFAWIKFTDNHIVKTERRPDGAHGFFIRKGRARALVANVTLPANRYLVRVPRGTNTTRHCSSPSVTGV